MVKKITFFCNPVIHACHDAVQAVSGPGDHYKTSSQQEKPWTYMGTYIRNPSQDPGYQGNYCKGIRINLGHVTGGRSEQGYKKSSHVTILSVKYLTLEVLKLS